MGTEGDHERLSPVPAFSPGHRYAIRVEGLLDAHWSEWLNGMTLTHEEGGERMTAAWAARFREDLPVLTADLPPATILRRFAGK